MRFFGSLFLMIALALATGCGSSSVSENVVKNTSVLIEELRTQVQTQEYHAAIKTLDKINESGSVDARSMTEFLALKARAEIGTDNIDAAKATIAELERSDDMATIHLVRGELEVKNGNRTAAQTEFAKAKQFDSSVVIPRY